MPLTSGPDGHSTDKWTHVTLEITLGIVDALCCGPAEKANQSAITQPDVVDARPYGMAPTRERSALQTLVVGPAVEKSVERPGLDSLIG